MKKNKTLQSLKKQLKKTLPEKISDVIQSYEDFSKQSVPDDAKGFTAHHSACKSAVVHAETLLKLAKWTDDSEEMLKNDDLSNDVLKLLDEAKEELNES